MAAFEIGTAAKIIPEFDGNRRNLSNFLGMIDFYASILATTTHTMLLNFVLATKLSDSVKNKLVTETKPESLTQLKETLLKNYKSASNPSQIHTELLKTQQGSLGLNQYVARIEHLTAQLNEMQITENEPEARATIVRLNDQLASTTFKNGLAYSLKNTVIAARPETFKDAANVALEVQKQAGSSYPNSNFRNNYNNNRRQTNNYNGNRFNNPSNNKQTSFNSNYRNSERFNSRNYNNNQTNNVNRNSGYGYNSQRKHVENRPQPTNQNQGN